MRGGQAMKLYDLELSGNSYRVRLLLSLLGLKHETVAMNLMKGEQREPWFLKLNPRGQVPTLDDDGTVVWDSMAILVYLARKYGGEKWLPLDAKEMAEVMQWLAVMENETLYGLGKARVICKFKLPGSLEDAQLLGRKGLDVLEQRLAAHQWLALERVTIADIGCFPYVALASEGEIHLDAYPSVRSWIDRIKSLPGFVGMPGI
jgi:glutathione S-transferase